MPCCRYSSHLPQREVSVSNLVLDPLYVYTVIPHPTQRLREGKYFLRAFADQNLEVTQIRETTSLFLPGSWDKVSDRDTSGGPLRVYDEKAKAWKENAKWCQNPQFLLTTTKPRTAYVGERSECKNETPQRPAPTTAASEPTHAPPADASATCRRERLLLLCGAPTTAFFCALFARPLHSLAPYIRSPPP
jgi:hypothetical protein